MDKLQYCSFFSSTSLTLWGRGDDDDKGPGVGNEPYSMWYQSAKNWILERQSDTKMQLHESAGESLRDMPGYSLVSSYSIASCGKGRVWDAHSQWTEARS